jgi:5-methyltetrahydropteroyltriglutamate--homocysteine methyltransferase
VVGEHVAGFRLMKITDLAARRPAARAVIGRMRLPRAVPQPIAVDRLRHRPIAVQEYEYAQKHTQRPLKVPLPSPYLLMWNAWDREYSREAYPTPLDLGHDLARVLREEIRALHRAGADFVQLDDPAIQHLLNPKKYMHFLRMLLGHQPKSAREELATAVELVNATVHGISGVKIGFHVCRGNWPAPEDILPAGDYGPILPALLDLRVQQLVLEFATPRAGPVEVFRDYPTRQEIGLGVIDVKNPHVETSTEIRTRVQRALRFFEARQLYLNPDCGFASGRTWPVATRLVALQKLTAMVGAARRLRKEHA